MLELNVHQSRPLSFEVEMTGIPPKQAQAFLRVTVDGVEYGFKGVITEKDITVDLPALKSVVSRVIKEGEEIDAKLEIYSGGHYLNPWNGQFIVRTPAFIEAKPNFQKARVITEKKVEESVREKITEKSIIEYMVKKGTTNKKVQSLILEGAIKKAESKDPQTVMNSIIDFYNKSKKL